jgi:hypothetical protein
VQLGNPSVGTAIGRNAIAAVTIIDDDMPGSFTFTTRKRYVKESDGVAVLTVARVNGCSGNLTVELSVWFLLVFFVFVFFRFRKEKK